MMKTGDIYQQILDVAESLIQSRGYNAFSYRDISEWVGVKTSSIHYHFPTKADLGKVVVQKHLELLAAELEQILNHTTWTSRKKLEVFIDAIVARTYQADRKMCLGGMLAAEVLTLPEPIQNEVRAFFQRIEEWLKQVLKEGIARKEFNIHLDTKSEVMVMLALLEGSLLLARLFQEEKRLAVAKKKILERLTR